MVSFGKLLATHRKARRLSQSGLAELANFDHSYISRLEAELRSPTRSAVMRFADVLNLTEREEVDMLASAGFVPVHISVRVVTDPTLILLHDELMLASA